MFSRILAITVANVNIGIALALMGVEKFSQPFQLCNRDKYICAAKRCVLSSSKYTKNHFQPRPEYCSLLQIYCHQ